jgi:lysozyme
MDPEIAAELSKQLKELSDIISQDASPAIKNLSESSDNASTRVGNVNKAFRSLDDAAGSFTKALLNGTGELNKYTSALDSMGTAAILAGKALGPMGLAAGLVAAAFTKVLSAATAQTDNLLKFSDGISRLGAVNTFTTNELQKMANSAGLASGDFQKMLKPMQSMGNAFQALGNGAADSVKKFAEQTKYSAEESAKLRRLGYASREEQIQAQADYNTLMSEGGVSLRDLSKTTGGLKSASLAYIDNLNAMSAATGESVEQTKKTQAASMANIQFQLFLAKKHKEMDAAKTQAEKDAIKKQIDSAQNAVDVAQRVGGGDAAAAMAQQITQGFVSGPFQKALALQGTGQDYAKTASAVNAGKFDDKAADEFRANLVDKTLDFATKNSTALSVNSGLASAANINTGTLTTANQLAGYKPGSVPKNGPKDKAQDARNALTDTEIDASVGMDKLINTMNPFQHGLTLATAAGLALAAALALATFNLGKAALGKAGGLAGLIGGGAPKGAAAAAEAVGGMGKAAGGGMLTGLVEALAAAGAAGPEVALGGVALGAAIGAIITGIGAGLAIGGGLISIMLPSLAKSLKAFNDINGENLKNAGIGMAALGVGIIAIGAGQVAGAMGRMANFFTGGSKEDPLKTAAKQLIYFQTFPIDGAKVKTNADALIAFSDAMAKYKGGPSLGTAIKDIAVSGLSKLFGQDSPTEAFLKFSKMDFGPNAEKNSDAFLKFATAMGSFQGGGASGGGGGAMAAGAALGAGAVGAVGGALGAVGTAAGGALGKAGGAVGKAGAAAGGALGKAGSVLGKAGGAAAGAIGSFGNWVMDLIAGHEGVRTKPYKDSLGKWTIGVGHLIGDGSTLPPEWNREFSKDEVMKLYQQDFDKHKQAASNIPGFNKLNEKGQAALTDLTFNMGPSWYKKWPHLTAALSAGDVEGAAAQLSSSKWAGQVGRRGPEDISLLRQGKLQARNGGMFDGPLSGYPATLHGGELVAPLGPDSLLMKLAKTPATDAAAIETIVKGKTAHPHSSGNSGEITAEMFGMMANKLDKVISVLESSHGTQNKLLRNSMA